MFVVVVVLLFLMASVNNIVAVLPGTTVKLTVVEQRLGILNGIGQLSHHTVSGSVSVQSLATTATECFIPVLQQEGELVNPVRLYVDTRPPVIWMGKPILDRWKNHWTGGKKRSLQK